MCHCHEEKQGCSSCGQHCQIHSKVKCGCCKNDCQCACHESQEDGSYHAQELLALADIAWMEVLKEKIMERIRTSDNKIDEMADIVYEANRTRWHNKMNDENNYQEYEEQLQDLFEREEESNEDPKKRRPKY